MIRTTLAKDEQNIIDVAKASGLFEESQTGELASMLKEFHQADDSNDIWLVDEHAGEIVGIAFLAPEKMTHGTWNLYLIAVRPEHQRNGLGRRMLKEVTRLLSERGERLLLVETSGTADFEYVRDFYRKHGFHEEAVVREFYDSGVDKIVYRMVL